MEYEFYIDLFFLADFYFNLLSLFLSAALMQCRTNVVRLCLAAAIGSFWNCFLIIFPCLPVRTELIVTVTAVGGLMTVTAFPGLFVGSRERYGENAKKVFTAIIVLFFASSLINGCFTFSVQHFYLSDGECMVLTGLICLMAERLFRQINSKRKVGNRRYQVRLYYRGKSKDFLAMADSGNRLTVPGTERPVSLISYQDCAGFCDAVSGGFYIPYRAVGTENGLLFAMLFEKMVIMGNGRSATIENPAVAIVKESLSCSGDFSMILPEEYVPEE